MSKKTGRRASASRRQRRVRVHVINHNAAGIDVGSEVHYVAVPPDRDTESVRSFKCFTADLTSLADWLIECGIETVAMESTWVYWIPLFQILESHGLEVLLVNAGQVKNAQVAILMFWVANGSSSFTLMGYFRDRFGPRTGSVYFVLTFDTVITDQICSSPS